MTNTKSAGGGPWGTALRLARETPASRNRYVDFLRALSILFVIFGHWTAAAAYADGEGGLVPTHLLAITAKSHPFTWLIQVMPVFFFVGGFSNAVSWSAAKRRGSGYAAWLESRLRRLIGPVMVPLFVWVGIAATAHLAGVSRPWISAGSQMALIPIWFLAVYVVIALLVPITFALWERFGWGSFFGMLVIGSLIDVAFFQANWHALGWLNYVFVWSGIHQLGYAWSAGELDGWKRPLLLAGTGGVLLISLVHFGPYPISMVGVPGDAVSNTTPPKVALFGLGALQIGLLLSVQVPMKRWLRGLRPWAGTVLINGMIMTIFLWHMTVMILLVGAAHLMGDFGLHAAPGTSSWWQQKPLWLVACSLALLPMVPLFGRFERPRPLPLGAANLAAWRLVLGALCVCFGLALVAKDGIAGDGPLDLRLLALVPPFLGAALVRRWTKGVA